MPKPYEVEVAMRVDRARVWKALTDPDEIAEWFGWQAETLVEEIQFIFVDHSTADHENFRLNSKEDEMSGMYLEVVARDGNSVVRAVQPGEEDGEGPDAMEEGWIAFLHQLKRYVEEHDSDTRRTLYLTGAGRTATVDAAVATRLPGEDWYAGIYTRVINTGDFGPGLGVLYTHAPLDSDKHENVSMTLSVWGLSDAEFFEVTTDWFGWWQGLVDGAEVIVNHD